MPKVSVVIPIYNVEKYLQRCVDSVLNQTLKDIEIICINDGSTDNSALILDNYKDISNIKIITQENSGISVARNIGIKNSSGDFIAFLDSDDFVDNDFYEKLYNKAVEFGADIACASIIRENDKKQIVLINYSDVQKSNDIKCKFKLAKSPEYNFVWNKLFRKNFLIEKNIEFISGMIYEDMCFIPDTLEASNLLITVPDTYYHYWKHSGSVVKGSSDKHRADKLKAFAYLMEKCKKYNVVSCQKNELIYKEDIILFGIPFIRIKVYRATKKIYLFGIIPILKIIKKI